MDTSRSAPLTPGGRVGRPGADATAGVTELYRAHAVGLIRLAIVMLGTARPPRTSCRTRS